MTTHSKYRVARDRGGAFLLGHLHADGAYGDPGQGVAHYYKVPLALAVCGEGGGAGEVMHWIRRHGLRQDGDFGPRPPQACGYNYTYYNAWLVMGAHRQGQFDLSQRGAEFLLRNSN